VSYILIENDEDLRFLHDELLKKKVLGLDTEFRRTTKDNMKLALLQINDGEEIYLIDILKIDDNSIINKMILSESIIKVLHSCKEDIEAIYSWTGSVLKNIFDTQLAEAFLGNEFSISYQSLVSKNLDLHLKKDETRSNWIRRPLRESQLDYAASDVEFLIHLYEDQTTFLEKSNKIPWLREELNFLTEKVLEESSSIIEPLKTISSREEKILLERFNHQIVEISRNENINPTLFFSKRNQRNFLRHLIDGSVDEALSHITKWRAKLIKSIVRDLV
tara:strand:- start:1774 stop:2601 length:828 start_codon:yes stop_codon:yes gene_type:complete